MGREKGREGRGEGEERGEGEGGRRGEGGGGEGRGGGYQSMNMLKMLVAQVSNYTCTITLRSPMVTVSTHYTCMVQNPFLDCHFT